MGGCAHLPVHSRSRCLVVDGDCVVVFTVIIVFISYALMTAGHGARGTGAGHTVTQLSPLLESKSLESACSALHKPKHAHLPAFRESKHKAEMAILALAFDYYGLL